MSVNSNSLFKRQSCIIRLFDRIWLLSLLFTSEYTAWASRRWNNLIHCYVFWAGQLIRFIIFGKTDYWTCRYMRNDHPVSFDSFSSNLTHGNPFRLVYSSSKVIKKWKIINTKKVKCLIDFPLVVQLFWFSDLLHSICSWLHAMCIPTVQWTSPVVSRFSRTFCNETFKVLKFFAWIWEQYFRWNVRRPRIIQSQYERRQGLCSLLQISCTIYGWNGRICRPEQQCGEVEAKHKIILIVFFLKYELFTCRQVVVL